MYGIAINKNQRYYHMAQRNDMNIRTFDKRTNIRFPDNWLCPNNCSDELSHVWFCLGGIRFDAFNTCTTTMDQWREASKSEMMRLGMVFGKKEYDKESTAPMAANR